MGAILRGEQHGPAVLWRPAIWEDITSSVKQTFALMLRQFRATVVLEWEEPPVGANKWKSNAGSNLSEWAMRMFCRGAQFATSRADICLVRPEKQVVILNIGWQKYLGKRTQSQPNSSKSMVSGHMQHSVVPGSCSSLHVRCAVLFVRARQAVRLMSSCIYGACADSIAPISISSCSAVRETTLTTMPRFSSGLFTQILFSGSSLSLWISIGVVVLIFLAVRYRAILFVFHCRVLTTLWEIVAGWFIIAPPPFSEWSDSPGQVKQVKWDPSATVGSQFDLVVFCMGEWHCLALLVNRHKIHLEYNWSQNKPWEMCQITKQTCSFEKSNWPVGHLFKYQLIQWNEFMTYDWGWWLMMMVKTSTWICACVCSGVGAAGRWMFSTACTFKHSTCNILRFTMAMASHNLLLHWK